MGKPRDPSKPGRERGATMRREAKIGIFLTGALIISAIFVLFVGDVSTIFKKPGYTLSVFIDSASGLDKGADVQMAGVKIGAVKEIRLAERKAQILMDISPKYQVPKGSKAALASLGLLGERYVEITPSEAPEFCRPGDALEAAPSVSFDQLGSLVLSIGQEIKEVSTSLREITGEKTRMNLEKTLENLSSFSERLNTFMADNKADLQAGIHNASQTAKEFDQKIGEISKNIDDTVLLMKGVVQDNRENIKFNLDKIKELLLKVEESLRLLSESLEKINKGEGTLGKLIDDPKLYDDARDTLDSVKKTAQSLGQLRATGSFRADYLGESEKVKAYINVGFSLARRYFLMAQIAQDPRLNKFLYSAQGGVRLGPFVPRAGIIESEFGAGIDYLALQDRLVFSLEGYDFQRDDGPHFRFTSQFSILKYFYLLLGVDDFGLSPKREFFFGLGLGTR
jgi:phospholipid/cholesterol/gamma-HCH transport system substrate-binding protein